MPEASGLPSVQDSGGSGGGQGRGLGRASGRSLRATIAAPHGRGLLEVSPHASTAASDQGVTVADSHVSERSQLHKSGLVGHGAQVLVGRVPLYGPVTCLGKS